MAQAGVRRVRATGSAGARGLARNYVGRAVRGGTLMLVMKDRKLAPEAEARWTRRSEALEAGAVLVSNKPDRDSWTLEDHRLFRYAMAVSRRMDKLQ